MTIELSGGRSVRILRIQPSGETTYDLTTPTGSGRSLVLNLTIIPGCNSVWVGEESVECVTIDPETGEDSVVELSTQELAADIEAVLSSPPRPPRKVVTPLTMLSNLTPEEQAAVLLSTDPEVSVFRALAIAAREIVSDDPRTIAGLNLLVSKGLIAPERLEALWTPPATTP